MVDQREKGRVSVRGDTEHGLAVGIQGLYPHTRLDPDEARDLARRLVEAAELAESGNKETADV